MGAALQLLTGRATNPGAVLTNATPGTGDSFVVRNFSPGTRARLESLWAFGATAGVLRIFSPLMHDNVHGLRSRYTAADPSELIPDEAEEYLYPQDTLAVQLSGGAAETDTLGFVVIYDDLPGTSARLYSWEQLKPRVSHILGIECNLTSGAAVGDYGGSQAITANFDVLRANTDYAILGYNVDVGCTAVGVRGPDLGNLRVGGPGSIRHEITSSWFVDLSKKTGLPLVPVFNSANKGNTLVDLVHTAAAAAVNVSFILAQLSGS